MYISPALALFIDTTVTILAQSGYIIQKKAHQSVEAHNSTITNESERKSGFYTCKWILGISIATIAGFFHAGKCQIIFFPHSLNPHYF